jgi:hypothetical protein
MTATASPTGLDAAQRTQLERLVTRARAGFEADLAAQAEGRFGIHGDGTIEEEQALPDDAGDRATRRDLVEIINHICSLGESPPDAVGRLLREAAFTHLNRLLAIRIAEAIGLLPESMAKSRQSRGFKDLGEIMPILGDDYWGYLLLCGDELAADAPALFDPRNPLLELKPSAAALDEVVTLVGDPAASEIWSAPDALGWVYQYFNTGDERRAMREASPAPRTSRELAVRNQFFTPGYVVDFLVQNTLGRRLVEADPSTLLRAELPLLVDPPSDAGPPLDLYDVRVLDPAVGSGHFLLGCYDLLERAWALQDVQPAEAATRIVASLWGVDIDPRCTQVASAALILRARRHCRNLTLARPNLICARALPGDAQVLPDRNEVPADLHQLVTSVADTLAQAPLLGVLLKAEEALARDLRGLSFGGGTGTLTLTDEAYADAERRLADVLAELADAASASATQRLFVAEAHDALRLVDVCRTRFDIVLMNPPYGLAPKVVERYLKAEYPTAWTDLYAAFLVRGLALLREHGYVGALTSSQFFTTRRMLGIRKALVQDSRPVAIVDLGPGVLQGAAVNTTASVIPSSRKVGPTRYLDLTTVTPDRRGDELASRMQVQSRNVDLSEFAKIDGMPFAFHVAREQVDLWDATGRFEPDLGIVRKGGSTFDNFRFLRCRWEVPAETIGSNWIPYQKGGDYQPYFAPSHLVVDWRDDGKHLREEGVRRGVLPQVMQSSTHWKRPGLCFPRVNKGFGVRIMPAGEIFTDKAIAIFANEGISPTRLLGLLNSTPIAALLQTFGRSRFIEAGTVKGLPIDRPQFEKLGESVDHLVAALVDIFREHESFLETSASFVRVPQTVGEFRGISARRVDEVEDAQDRIDQIVGEAIIADAEGLQTVPRRALLVGEVLTHTTEPRDEWAVRSFSYLVGCAFGRWDVRIGRDPSVAPPATDLFDSVPACPPGMLVGPDGFPAAAAPDAYPLELPASGLLIDEPGHAWDVEARLRRAAEAVFEDPETALTEMLALLEGKTLRDHLRRYFFKSHLSRYSKSRRKAPIYWPLTTASAGWGAWVYASQLTRETLYAVASEAGRRERLTDEAIMRLRREQNEGGAAGRVPRKVAEELDAEQKLAEELRRFRVDVERIAGLGWKPDLNDGIVLCAAPLADLFPAWPDAKKARDELRKGQYEWAAVAQWAGEL